MLQLTRNKKARGGVVGIDIEAGSIAATEVRTNGSSVVSASAIAPLERGAFHEGEVLDADSLTAALKSLFAEHKLAKRVRLGVGNQRVVVRRLRLPAIEDPKEMEAAVRFQAQEQIPMPLDQAVLEYQVVGGVAAEEGSTPQLDVVVVAARKEMVSSLVAPLRQAGLEPVGVDLSAFGMIRALAGDLDDGGADERENAEQRPAGAALYCNVGDITNLAVARERACLFTRVSHVGLEAISAQLCTAQNISPEHAMQWLHHVGLDKPLEEVDGDPETIAEARRLLEDGVSALIDELRLSLDYYGALEGALPVEKIVLCGPGSAIGGLASRMEGLGIPIASSRPSALAGMDDVSAARLTLPYGLALES